jgi:RNA polymerase sigma-70 factor (ECF subfamily)
MNQSISTWIWIAVNLPSLFKKIIYKEIRTDILPQVVAETYSSEKMSNLDKCQCIQKTEETNKMIILMTLDGLEYQEISVIGITEETLRVRIHRIKKFNSMCTK